MFRALSNINSFLFFFTKKLRLSNPWNFKVPLLISIPYFIFLLSHKTQVVFIPILASVFIIIGVAGIGYLTNDLGDRHKDSLIKKQNATAQLGFFGIAFLILLFLFLAVAPWFYLPMTRLSVCLLVLQFLLFYLYAFPPFRLKERGFLGVLTDAGYAHVNPALLAAYTFYLYAGESATQFFTFLLLLTAWQFLLGIRNILFHQVNDHDKDLESGTQTFVTKKGILKVEALLKKIILPLEVFLFLVFSVFISGYFIFFPVILLIYWLFLSLNLRKELREKNYRSFAYLYLDDLYVQWLPLIVLTGLVINSINFLPVLILHFVIFRSGIKTFVLSSVRRFK